MFLPNNDSFAAKCQQQCDLFAEFSHALSSIQPTTHPNPLKKRKSLSKKKAPELFCAFLVSILNREVITASTETNKRIILFFNFWTFPTVAVPSTITWILLLTREKFSWIRFWPFYFNPKKIEFIFSSSHSITQLSLLHEQISSSTFNPPVDLHIKKKAVDF